MNERYYKIRVTYLHKTKKNVSFDYNKFKATY